MNSRVMFPRPVMWYELPLLENHLGNLGLMFELTWIQNDNCKPIGIEVEPNELAIDFCSTAIKIFFDILDSKSKT